MKYEEFKDVMIAKGYSIVDVLDCIHDFLISDACPKYCLSALDQHVALFCDHIMDRFERLKKHYDVDDAFSKLYDQYDREHNYYHDRPVDDIFDDLCFGLWNNICYLDSTKDDYWQDLLKDC